MKYTKEILVEAVQTSTSYSAVLRKLGLQISGGNHNNLKNNIEKFGLTTDHFLNTNAGAVSWRRKTAKEILVYDKDLQNRRSTKQLRRALKESRIEEKCECGNQGKWEGKSLILEIDHKDGNWQNNRIDNLRFLCPNCHSQTFNYYNKKHKSKCLCGKVKHKSSKQCVLCGSDSRKETIKNRRKVKERPTRDKLLAQIETLGYCGTGRFYGVSDNCIRKWLKGMVA